MPCLEKSLHETDKCIRNHRRTSRNCDNYLRYGSLEPRPNQHKPHYRTTGDEGNLVGTVSFVGVPPEPRRIDTSADPICETINPEATTEDVIVTDGKLANVFVYARAGDALDAYNFEAPSSDASLEHKGCHFVPHALGMQTQQILKVLNSGPTTHNTHPTPVLRALEIARDRGFTRIRIRSDYNSMRRKLRECFRSGAAGNGDLEQKILNLARRFEWIDFGYVPRRKNQIAHLLARRGRFLAPGPSAQEAAVPIPSARNEQAEADRQSAGILFSTASGGDLA